MKRKTQSDPILRFWDFGGPKGPPFPQFDREFLARVASIAAGAPAYRTRGGTCVVRKPPFWGSVSSVAMGRNSPPSCDLRLHFFFCRRYFTQPRTRAHGGKSLCTRCHGQSLFSNPMIRDMRGEREVWAGLAGAHWDRVFYFIIFPFMVVWRPRYDKREASSTAHSDRLCQNRRPHFLVPFTQQHLTPCVCVSVCLSPPHVTPLSVLPPLPPPPL